MPFEQPHQDQKEQKVPANTQEKTPETVDPVAMAKEHIAAAQELTAIESKAKKNVDTRYMALALDLKNPPTVDTRLGFNILKRDTEKVLERRIAEAQRLLKEHEAEWHQSPASRGSMLSMKPTYKQPAELAGPLARLKEAYEKVKITSDENYVQQLRVDMGLPALPRQLVPEKEDFGEMARAAATNADPTMQVNLEFLRKEFEQVMADLDAAEIAIEAGGAVAITIATGGSGPAAMMAAQLALTIATESEKVIVANKPVDAAVQDAVISAISNALGMKIGQSIGKQLQAGSKVAGIDKLLGRAGELIEQIVNNKAAVEATKKAASALARNGLEGGIDAALSTGAHSIGNDIRKDGVEALGKVETYTTAAGKAGDAVIPGVLGGAVVGTTMEFSLSGLRRLYTKNAPTQNVPETTQAELRDNIMRLPDADRPQAAEIILGHPLTSAQKQAVLTAHDVSMKDGQKYSQSELMQKMRILEASGIGRDEADQLLRMGVCGTLPPPPAKKPLSMPPDPKISVSRSTLPLPTSSNSPSRTIGPKPPPPPPIPGMKRSPLAPPPPPAAKNTIIQKAAPSDADTNPPAMKNRVTTGPVLKRMPRETPQDVKFLKEYGHLTEEQIALNPQLENKLEEMKKRGLFSSQFYYEGKAQEHMDISRSSDKLDLHRLGLSDLRNHVNPGPQNTRSPDYQDQAREWEKIGIHELLISKPIRAKVRNGTRKEIRVSEEPGLLWGKKITKQEVERPVYEERDVKFSDVVPSSSNQEPCVSLTYFVTGSQSYRTNQLNNYTKDTLVRQHGYDTGATKDPHFQPNLPHEEMQKGILANRDGASRLTGRPGNQISISLTLPKSEAEALQKYFQSHPEEIRPFFLRGGQEYMLTHMPPPFAQWDQQPRPVRFRTFDAQAKTFKDEDVKLSRN